MKAQSKLLVLIIFLTYSDAEVLLILICIDLLYNSLQRTFARLHSAFTVLIGNFDQKTIHWSKI